MKPCVLLRPIGAILLNDPLTATTLPLQSAITIIGPARQIEGFVEVECNGNRYAVFQHDLDQCGETIGPSASERA